MNYRVKVNCLVRFTFEREVTASSETAAVQWVMDQAATLDWKNWMEADLGEPITLDEVVIA